MHLRSKSNAYVIPGTRSNLSRGLFLLAAVVLSGFLNTGHSQEISGEPAAFISELNNIVDELPQREKQKEAEEYMESFAAWWSARPLDDSLSRMTCRITAKVLEKRMRFQPHVTDFLDAVRAFPADAFGRRGMIAWMQYADQLLSGRKSRKFPELVTKAKALFSGLYIYQSRSISWQLTEPSGLELVFDDRLLVRTGKTNLMARVTGDSCLIRNTEGTVDLMEEEWIGIGGEISWERVEFAPDEVFAEIPKYRLDLRSTSFEVDSVVFTYKGYLDRPLLGRLEEKLMMDVNVERASYPRFSSYLNDLVLRDIFPDIDYRGGFTLEGRRVIGSAAGNTKAALDFKRKGELFVRLRSKGFAIDPDRISSSRASVAIYNEGDSIFHPGLRMRYLNDKRELSLIRTDEALGQSPFMDTWHMLDMYFEAMYWKMDEESIDFQDIKGLNSEGTASFESVDYYSRGRYELLQGIDEFNPLDLLYRYSRRIKSKDFHLDNYVDFVRKPPEQVKAVLLNLANRGFINYDLDRDRIYVKDRLFKYIMARAGRADYDVMQLKSTITALPNASLSLLNFDLKIRGVPVVYLSDSQQVFIFPEEQEIVMKQNRDFTFSGKVQAGHFLFFSKESNFSYEDFKINMPVINEMKFRVRSFEPDGTGFYYLQPVDARIQDLSGELFIDKPFNKSGKDSNPEYPIFKAGTEAFVYYDDKKVRGGVYDRERFNYRIEPFTIDSLDNFNTRALAFEGYLNSGGIFPEIHEPLKVQPDYSLGFVTNTPVTGYPVYGGKGTYYAVIDLSNQGLRGRGSIEYLASESASEDIVFYLDSARAKVDKFSLREQLTGPEYPMASGEEVNMLWLPYEDVMNLENLADPFLLYAGEAALDGGLRLSPDGLRGDGAIEFEDALMASNDYEFLHHEFKADTADFSLKAYDLSELAFAIRDYKAHVDLEGRQGKFLSNGGVARVEFLLNDYITFMDECIWLMDDARISLRNTTSEPKDYSGFAYRDLVEQELTGSEFVSVHPAQDSLRFLAEKGVFDLKESVIRAEGVQLIRVADAAVFPDEQKVSIYRKAEMGTLSNAVVLTDLETKYHLMNKAEINIFSRYDYNGSAVYPYEDETGAVTEIPLRRIGADDGTSFGEGSITDSMNLFLNPAFAFQGDVRMDAPEALLLFSGGFRIAHDCDSLKRPWVRFESRINPDTVIIPLADELKDLNNDKIEAAIMYSSRGEGMYPAFLRKRDNYSDEIVLSSGGAIMYDRGSQEYRIALRDRLLGEVDYGNYLSLSKLKCELSGIGDASLGLDFGRVEATGFGEVRHLIIPDSTRLQLSLSLDFFLSGDALDIMAEDFELSSAPAWDLAKGYYTNSLYSLMGPEEAMEVIAEINMYGSLEKIPDELKKTLIISNVTLAWNEVERVWVSEGPLAIASIAGRQLNREVEGKLVVERRRSGDIFTLYVEAEPGNYYLLSYSRGLMQVYSANDDFNTTIREEDPKDRTLKVKRGEHGYRYIISTERKRRSFLREYMPEVLLDE